MLYQSQRPSRSGGSLGCTSPTMPIALYTGSDSECPDSAASQRIANQGLTLRDVTCLGLRLLTEARSLRCTYRTN